jgi:hypothetical protein
MPRFEETLAAAGRHSFGGRRIDRTAGCRMSQNSCMDTLRHLSADAWLDPTKRILSGERAIRSYIREASKDPIERRHLLDALDKEVGSVPSASDFWSAMRDLIAQLRRRNASPDEE